MNQKYSANPDSAAGTVPCGPRRQFFTNRHCGSPRSPRHDFEHCCTRANVSSRKRLGITKHCVSGVGRVAVPALCGASWPSSATDFAILASKKNRGHKRHCECGFCHGTGFAVSGDRSSPTDIAAPHVLPGMISNTAVPEQMSRVPKGRASPTNSVFFMSTEKTRVHHKTMRDWIPLQDCTLRPQGTELHRRTLRLLVSGLRSGFVQFHLRHSLINQRWAKWDRWRNVRSSGRLSAFDANGVAEPRSTVLFWRRHNVLSSCSGWRQERADGGARRALSSALWRAAEQRAPASSQS